MIRFATEKVYANPIVTPTSPEQMIADSAGSVNVLYITGAPFVLASILIAILILRKINK